MKSFFAKIIILIALAGAVIYWEWHRTEERIQNIGPVLGSPELATKIVKLFRQVPAVTVVIAGDSKAERQIDPAIFAEAGFPAINIAVPSGDLWSLVQNLEFLGLNKSPAIFLISIGSYQINDGNNDKDRYTPEQFFSFTPQERLNMFKSGYFLAARTMLKKEELYRRYPEIVGAMVGRDGEYANYGFLPIDPTEFSCMKVHHGSSVSIWSSYRNMKTDGARWRLFQEAIQKLSTWPGKYVLFNSPHSKKGLECIKGSYVEEMEKRFSAQVAKAVEPYANVKFVDLFWDSPFEDTYFYDPGHLNKFGAELFTRWWLASLKQQGWLSTRSGP